MIVTSCSFLFENNSDLIVCFKTAIAFINSKNF
jgi:hypothetical protein